MADPLARLLDDHWEFMMRSEPVWATLTGDHRYDDRLPEVSEAAMAERLAELRELQQRLAAIDPDPLSPADRLNHGVLARSLENDIGTIRYRSYRFPISKVGGVQTSLPELPVLVPAGTPHDLENYISRLKAVRRHIDQHIEVMRAGLDDGQIPARATLEGVDESIAAQVVADPTESIFYKPFAEWETKGMSEGADLAEAARQAITQSVIPGFEALQSFVRDEYYPHSRAGIAASDLPEGHDYYRFCIRYHTTLDWTPERIHEVGQAEVKRIRGEMEAAIAKAGFEGGLREFIAFLRRDPRFYADTPEALLRETAYLLKRIDGELPRLFRTLPRLPYGIRPVPDFSAPGQTAAYYMPGSGDGTKAGFYYVNTYDLTSRPLYELEALSLHEAVPGHHLQLALQAELDLPKLRRFASFTSYVEGWALYAERLGLEMGFYTDPYSDFGRLSYEMWRACRLVVDTGMHALGWSRQQAIDFMLANTSSSELNIANEVDRYIAWPGQALAYKLGELKIRELRTRAERSLGGAFDVRAFHEVVLGSGSLPLDMLESLVDRWIGNRDGSADQR
jgi:uncharacterized protein (DUF885 family)